MRKYKSILLTVSLALMVSSTVTNSYSIKKTDSADDTEEIVENLPDSDVKIKESDELEMKYDLTQEKIDQIAMLNYLSFLAEDIRQSSNSKLYLEEVINDLINDLNVSTIDQTTEDRIERMIDDIQDFRMIEVKRERLQFLYEQNQSKALRSAVPNPMSVLTVVQSGTPLKALISGLSLAANSIASYQNTSEQNELSYLQSNWDLDDDDFKTITRHRTASFTYMIDKAREYNIEDKITLNEEMIQEFIKWQNNDNIKGRIHFLTSNQDTYEMYEGYWLLLSSTYYEDGNSEKCIESIDKYLTIKSNIFRKDYKLAETLPYAIASLADIYNGKDLYDKEQLYVNLLIENTNTEDYALRYFAAITLMDIYSQTNNPDLLLSAYQLAKTNVNNLAEDQIDANETYLKKVQKIEAEYGATKSEKADVKSYNSMLEKTRETELPPVNNTLLMNAELMLDLAREINIDQEEIDSIEGILHNNGDNLFLIDSLDNLMWYDEKDNLEPLDVLSNPFFGKIKITVPANYVCSESVIKVTITHKGKEKVIDDWYVKEVDRGKAKSADGYAVTYNSKKIKNSMFKNGDKVTVEIYPYGTDYDPIVTEYKAKKTMVTLDFTLEN